MNDYESYWYRAPHRRPGPGGHPQGDPPHHAHPGGGPAVENIDTVGTVTFGPLPVGRTLVNAAIIRNNRIDIILNE